MWFAGLKVMAGTQYLLPTVRTPFRSFTHVITRIIIHIPSTRDPQHHPGLPCVCLHRVLRRTLPLEEFFTRMASAKWPFLGIFGSFLLKMTNLKGEL
jgi:hypothetical protein